jgi:hypothetical protein
MLLLHAYTNQWYIDGRTPSGGADSNELIIGKGSDYYMTIFDDGSHEGYIGLRKNAPEYPIDINGSTHIEGDLNVTGNLTVNAIENLNVNGKSVLTGDTIVTEDFGVGLTTADATLDARQFWVNKTSTWFAQDTDGGRVDVYLKADSNAVTDYYTSIFQTSPSYTGATLFGQTLEGMSGIVSMTRTSMVLGGYNNATVVLGTNNAESFRLDSSTGNLNISKPTTHNANVTMTDGYRLNYGNSTTTFSMYWDSSTNELVIG